MDEGKLGRGCRQIHSTSPGKRDTGKNGHLVLKPVNGEGKQGAKALPSRLFYRRKMDEHNSNGGRIRPPLP